MATPIDAPVVRLYPGDVPQLRRPPQGDVAALTAAGEPQEFAETLAFLLTRPALELLPKALREQVVPGRRRPRGVGVRYWRMEAAFAMDVEGKESVQVAKDFGLETRLKLKDGSPAGKMPVSRHAKAYRQAGRRLLNALGAWPWALADEGRLPQNWHEAPEYRAALAVWHRAAWIAAAERLELSADCAAGRRRYFRSTSSTAEELYEAGLLGP